MLKVLALGIVPFITFAMEFFSTSFCAFVCPLSVKQYFSKYYGYFLNNQGEQQDAFFIAVEIADIVKNMNIACADISYLKDV